VLFKGFTLPFFLLALVQLDTGIKEGSNLKKLVREGISKTVVQ
jgi:hypothetical protein